MSHRETGHSYTLDSVLHPVTRDDFLRDYWTRNFLHIPGQADKLSDLFPWPELNRALEEIRFEPRRLVLVRAGKHLERSDYLDGARVNAAKLNAELSRGATMIFNQCEEVFPPLRDFCIHLERIFHVKVFTNLYAGWRSDNGFDIHWDPQDNLILQVSGRKHWKVWRPSRMYPLQDDIVDTSDKTRPVDSPIWDDILNTGSVLHIPRGWWHVAYPLNEPCLHLTVTIRNPTGIDLLHWVADSFKASETARMPLPVNAGAAEQRAWLESLKADLTTFWDKTVLDRYTAHLDSEAKPQPVIALPDGADPAQNRIGSTTLLETAIPRPLHFSFEDGTAYCRANGMVWQMSPDHARRLEVFNDYRPHQMSEITPEPDFKLSALIMTMVMSGVLRRSTRGASSASTADHPAIAGG
jgi:ribosomal protein L16 Arg81 hydroxylase